MDGYQMEDFLVNLYTKMGYSVDHTKLSRDQGADLIVSKFGIKTAIQAKNYQGNVGNDAVQQVVAAKAHYGCENAAVVTNSRFTDAAIELAKSNNVDLIERDKLDELIKKYY
jgi:restriction system protein